MATAGDVNGDGYADVIVGAYYYDNGQLSEGRASVFYGNAGAGLSVGPQQRRADDAAPIAHGGRSRTPGSFRLAALGRTPFGRGLIKLQWEVEPSNHLFNGSGIQESASWTDTGTAGAALNQLLTSLEPRDYHWRVRLRYHPATSPFASTSRWLTVPWNGWNETDVSLSPFIGGFVWEDADLDGIRDAGEPPLVHLPVHLLDSGGVTIMTVLTGNDGSYRFEIGLSDLRRVRFELPAGYAFTLPDQGADDAVDSDADTETGETPLDGPPFLLSDATNWSAGMARVGPCLAPDEPIFISNVRLGLGGRTILDFQDPNQPGQVTGYNVYRSSNAGLPLDLWTRMGTNVVDMDEGTANNQWVDQTNDPPLRPATSGS